MDIQSSLNFGQLARICSFAIDDMQALDTALAAVAGLSGSGTADALPRFTGTNVLGDSAISDDGDFVVITRQTRITTDLAHGDQIHAALQVITAGVALTEGDGGIQSFQQSTFDCTLGAAQSLAVFAGNTASRVAGSNALVNYGVLASASGGTQNFSFFGVAGILRNDGQTLLGTCWFTDLLLDDFLTVGGSTTLNGALLANGSARFNGSVGFGKAPISVPITVAVDAASIHAALVSIGLFAP